MLYLLFSDSLDQYFWEYSRFSFLKGSLPDKLRWKPFLTCYQGLQTAIPFFFFFIYKNYDYLASRTFFDSRFNSMTERLKWRVTCSKNWLWKRYTYLFSWIFQAIYQLINLLIVLCFVLTSWVDKDPIFKLFYLAKLTSDTELSRVSSTQYLSPVSEKNIWCLQLVGLDFLWIFYF